jgi:hypothetical protein
MVDGGDQTDEGLGRAARWTAVIVGALAVLWVVSSLFDLPPSQRTVYRLVVEFTSLAAAVVFFATYAVEWATTGKASAARTMGTALLYIIVVVAMLAFIDGPLRMWVKN